MPVLDGSLFKAEDPLTVMLDAQTYCDTPHWHDARAWCGGAPGDGTLGGGCPPSGGGAAAVLGVTGTAGAPGRAPPRQLTGQGWALQSAPLGENWAPSAY